MYHGVLVLQSSGINTNRYITIDLNHAIVIGPTPRHVMCRNKQCCPVSTVQFRQNMASRDPCFRETWRKSRDTMHLRRLFGPTSVLGRSIRILCCCVMDDDTNLLHLFRDMSKHIDR